MRRLKTVKTLATEGLWHIVSQVTSILGAIYLITTITSSMGAEKYGAFVLLFSLSTFFNQAGYSALSNGALRFQSIASKEENLDYYFSGCFLSFRNILLSTFAVLLVVKLIDFYSGYGAVDFYYLFLIFVLSSLTGLNSLFNAFNNAERKRKLVAVDNICLMCLKVILVELCVEDTVSSVFWTYIASLFLVVVVQCARRRPAINLAAVNSHSKFRVRFTKYYQPFIYWGVAGWLATNADRWLIENYFELKLVGSYVALLQISFYPMQKVIAVVISFFGPIIFSKFESAEGLNIKELITGLLVISMGIILLGGSVLYIFQEYYVATVLGSEFYLPNVVPLGFAAAIIGGTANLLAVKGMAELKSKEIMMSNLISYIIGLSLTACLVINYSAEGAAIALITSALVNYFAARYFLR